MSPLARRTALVTGGGTGIGAAISARLADAGASVLFGQQTEEEVAAALSNLTRPGRDITGVAADLSSAEGCARLVQACAERWGRLDILVNNAGIAGPPALSRFIDSNDAHLDLVIEVNLKAAFRCARDAARIMATIGGGVIVNITSVAAHAAQLDAAAYTASKAGLVGLTRALALELAEHSIRVVCVSPGDIDTARTPISASLSGDPSARVNPWARRTPLGRRGTPADIAAVVEFLCSEAAGFITGSELIVDGGWLSY